MPTCLFAVFGWQLGRDFQGRSHICSHRTRLAVYFRLPLLFSVTAFYKFMLTQENIEINKGARVSVK